MKSRNEIRFANQEFSRMRGRLLKNLDKETLAILYAKNHEVDGHRLLIVKDCVHPPENAYEQQGSHSLQIDKGFLARCLTELDSRVDVDTLVHVHTHPFTVGEPAFSSIDDDDEKSLQKYLLKKAPEIHLASIVLSQTFYKARIWEERTDHIKEVPAAIKTQKVSENLFLNDSQKTMTAVTVSMQDRTMLAFGRESLERITNKQTVTILGVGGIGSIVAENLVHTGFQRINLVDFDHVEITNLNRLAGAQFKDAENKHKKVDVMKRHLKSINPKAEIVTFPMDVFDKKVEKVIAQSDWLFLTTDNYSSTARIQDLAFKYYVPFISAATKIIPDNTNTQFLGEVILVRMGDGLCLNCLNRIDPLELAKESHPDEEIRNQLVQKGYVEGMDVKDPAIKTLNALVSGIATDVLVNQYTERHRDQHVIRYEDIDGPAVYEDKQALRQRKRTCYLCGGGHRANKTT